MLFVHQGFFLVPQLVFPLLKMLVVRILRKGCHGFLNFALNALDFSLNALNFSLNTTDFISVSRRDFWVGERKRKVKVAVAYPALLMKAMSSLSFRLGLGWRLC